MEDIPSEHVLAANGADLVIARDEQSVLTRQSRNQKAVHYLVPVSDSPNPFGASTDSLSPTHY
jgi:hypothetical protein